MRMDGQEEGHTDDVLVACAQRNNWATLTVDTALKSASTRPTSRSSRCGKTAIFTLLTRYRTVKVA